MQMDCPKCWGKNKGCARCGGDGKCDDVQLSPHFRLSELLDSGTARSKGLDNDPSPEVIANLRRLCNDAHMAVKDILAKAEVESAEEMAEDDWNGAVRLLKKKAASVKVPA